VPVVIIGLVRPPAVHRDDFLRWAVVEAGDVLLGRGPTVETMACTRGSIGGAPSEVRFDALLWAEGDSRDVTSLLTRSQDDGRIDGWTIFDLGTQRMFERRSRKVLFVHDEDPFADLPGLTLPGMKKVVFHCRRPDISRDHYRTIFRDHFPLTEVHMARALCYWQREVDATTGSSMLAADGVSEFRAADHADIISLYDNAESAAIVGADSDLFIDRTRACTLFGITHLRLSDGSGSEGDARAGG
jgi:hypothetical protein